MIANQEASRRVPVNDTTSSTPEAPSTPHVYSLKSVRRVPALISSMANTAQPVPTICQIGNLNESDRL